MKNLDNFFREMDFEAFTAGGLTTPATALPNLIKSRAFFLDVRTREEHAEYSLPFAVNIPLHELPDRLDEVPEDIPVILFSHGPWRSSVTMAYLTAKGFDQVSAMIQGLPEMAKMLKPGPLAEPHAHLSATEARPNCRCSLCC